MAYRVVVWITLFAVVHQSVGQSTSFGTSFGSNGIGGGTPYGNSYGTQSSQQCTQQCPFDYRPLCGSNGKTYQNACLFRCEQAFSLNLVQQSEGACSSGFNNNYGGQIPGQPGYPNPGFNFGSSYGNTVNSGATSPSCNWQCPASTSAFRNPYDNNAVSPFMPYGSGTYGSGMNTNYGNSPYGQQPIQTTAQICDNRGTTYANDCLFYRALCDAEKRGMVIAKSSCPYGMNNGYNNMYSGFGNNNRRGLLLDQSASTAKPV